MKKKHIHCQTSQSCHELAFFICDVIDRKIVQNICIKQGSLSQTLSFSLNSDTELDTRH